MGDAKPAATLLKGVVLGSSNVGKTSLLMQFVHGKFTPARRVTTGADFASKVLHLGDREVRARDRDGENGKRHDVWRMPPAMSEAAKAVGLPALGWQPQCALRPLWHQFCYYVQKSESLHLNFEPQ